MIDRRDKSVRAVDADWHAFRQRARETAFSEREFDSIERERYDLDTAGIDGRDNPETYRHQDDKSGWKGDARDDPLR